MLWYGSPMHVRHFLFFWSMINLTKLYCDKLVSWNYDNIALKISGAIIHQTKKKLPRPPIQIWPVPKRHPLISIAHKSSGSYQRNPTIMPKNQNKKRSFHDTQMNQLYLPLNFVSSTLPHTPYNRQMCISWSHYHYFHINSRNISSSRLFPWLLQFL